MARRKATRLETSGAQSVASRALQEETARMEQGQEPTPLSQMADVLIQMQKLMAQQQAESESRVLRVVEEQSASMREHMVAMEKRFIAMNAQQRQQFDNLLEEARERSREVSPEVRDQLTARAALDIQRRTTNMRVAWDSEARQIAAKLKEEDQVPWTFDEATTIRLSSWSHTYPAGIHNVPRSVAIQLMQGRIEGERLNRMKDILSADKPGSSIPKLGSNPSAIYAVAERVNALLPNKVE